MSNVRCQGCVTEVPRHSFPAGFRDVSTQVEWTGYEMGMATASEVREGGLGCDTGSAIGGASTEGPCGKALKLSG